MRQTTLDFRRTDMTIKQANLLMDDWGKSLLPQDFSETLYISIKGIGNKTFKSCSFHEEDNYMFIWTKQDRFLVDKKELGDFLAILNPQNTLLSKKVI